MARNRSNLDSPNQIKKPCSLRNLTGWLKFEAAYLEDKRIRSVILRICKELDAFVEWPEQPLLLWKGCTRQKKYHTYPSQIKKMAKEAKIPLDGRANGPAKAAFEIARGERPARYGSNNKWSIHHLYSGKFPYPGKTDTLHASKKGNHFTQSVGLVAIHPIADQMCDEYPFFAWLLRAKAFLKFGYDPDGVFKHNPSNEYGFHGRIPKVVHKRKT